MSTTDARAARDAFASLLEADSELAGRLPPSALDLLERFVGLLLEANRRLNLTRVVEPDAIARLHLLDSIASLPILDELGPGRALDLGSGGGVPGIPLAIARPAVRWTLLDSVGKKVDALREMVASLELDDVVAVADRAESLGRDPDGRETYDLVTARACAALPVLVEYALPLLRIGGTLLAWKGPISDGELRAGQAAAALLGGDPPMAAPAPASLGDHRFVMVRKVGPTPARYPRRPGEPSRRPLG